MEEVCSESPPVVLVSVPRPLAELTLKMYTVCSVFREPCSMLTIIDKIHLKNQYLPRME